MPHLLVHHHSKNPGKFCTLLKPLLPARAPLICGVITILLQNRSVSILLNSSLPVFPRGEGLSEVAPPPLWSSNDPEMGEQAGRFQKSTPLSSSPSTIPRPLIGRDLPPPLRPLPSHAPAHLPSVYPVPDDASRAPLGPSAWVGRAGVGREEWYQSRKGE